MTTSESPGNDAVVHNPAAPDAQTTTTTLPQPVPGGQPKKSNGLALSALFVGIGAFLFGLVPVFGALVGATGIVLGILAIRAQQSKGMALASIILGSLAIVASIGVTLGLGAVANYASSKATEEVAQPVAPEPIEETVEEPVEPEPVVEPEPTEEPVVEPEPEPEPEVPAEYESALAKAYDYSELMHMSKQGIYDQLTSEYGEKFSAKAAQYAIDNIKVRWALNALAKAKDYQETMNMSPEAIRDQLTSEFGEKFTAKEAAYAIDHLND